MDINEYLEQTCNLLHYAPYTKYDDMFHWWQRALEKRYHIKTVEIYSSEIFPRHIKLQGEQFYIHDKHFWNMYEHYLMAYFLCSKKLDIGMRYDTLLEMIRSMVLLAMANLLDSHPYLALSFAQEYQARGASMGHYNRSFLNTGQIPDIDILVQFSFPLVFFHEIGHSIYNSPGNERDKAQFTDFLLSAIRIPAPDEQMAHIYEEIEKIFRTDDKASLEEMFCDFLAENTLIDFADRVFKDDTVGLNVLTLIAEATVLPITLQAFLLQNKLHWEMLYYRFNHMDTEYHKAKKRVERTYTELTARGSFQTFLNRLFWSRRRGASFQDIEVQTVHEFDTISKELLGNPFFTFQILEREQSNRRMGSILHAQKMKNEILKWNTH